MVLLGVDLRTTAKHPSAVAVLDRDATLVHLGTFYKDEELIEIAESYSPQLVAIGTPLGLPEGLCCLESTCGCKFNIPHKKGRESEVELARMGISCFFTNKGSIIRRLIYRGIGLQQRLRGMGRNVIEVYPHATKVILFGDSIPPKNSSMILDFMERRLSNIVSGLESHLDRLDRNACDAMINAYTALLHSTDNTDTLGSRKEGLLALPKLVS